MTGDKLVLMYHSVEGKKENAVVGSFPLSMDRFIYQIESLMLHGWQPDFISRLHNPIKKGEKRFYICSDDGTVDWSRNVLPWCELREIPTHTGIITGPWDAERCYPLAHIIQVKLAECPRQELIGLSHKIKSFLSKKELAYVEKIYHYEKEWHRRIIKGAFNLIFDQDMAYGLLGELSRSEDAALFHRFEEPDYYRQFTYAELGIHTRSHWALGLDTEAYVRNEIDRSCQTLINFGFEPTKYFILPMQPRHGASVRDLIGPLRKIGYKGTLVSNSGQWNQESFIIPRIDGQKLEEFLGIKHFDTLAE
jgi:hypothetical protein